MAEINNVIAEASQDLQTIEDFVNLPAGSVVNPRLLPSVDVGTLAGTRQAIFEAGGLPATPFATKALMTAGALVDGKYAQVTDGGADNGLYLKTAGAWVKSAYDPLTQAKTDATAKANAAEANAKAYTDTNKADTLSKVQNTFDTKALMIASPLPDGSKALVDMDTEANNGFYKRVAGVWVDAEYNPPSKNLLSQDNITLASFVKTGFYISTATGAEGVSANYTATDYIPIESNIAYRVFVTINTYGVYGSAWYDVNKNFISGFTTNTSSTVIAPSNAAFVRLSGLKTNLSTAVFEPIEPRLDTKKVLSIINTHKTGVDLVAARKPFDVMEYDTIVNSEVELQSINSYGVNDRAYPIGRRVYDHSLRKEVIADGAFWRLPDGTAAALAKRVYVYPDWDEMRAALPTYAKSYKKIFDVTNPQIESWKTTSSNTVLPEIVEREGASRIRISGSPTNAINPAYIYLENSGIDLNSHIVCAVEVNVETTVFFRIGLLNAANEVIFTANISNVSGKPKVNVKFTDFLVVKEGAVLADVQHIGFQVMSISGKTGEIFIDDIETVSYKAKITLRFDDAKPSIYDTAYPIMQQYGFRGLIAVITNQVGLANDPDYPILDDSISKSGLLELGGLGWDLVSHTHSHMAYEGKTDEYMRDNYKRSRDYLLDELDAGAIAASCLVSPTGKRDLRAAMIQREFFDCQINSVKTNPQLLKQPVGLWQDSANDKGFWTQLGGRVGDNMTGSQLIAHAQEAIQKESWSIIMMHNILPDSSLYSTSVEAFTEFCAWLDLHRDEIDVVTVSDVVREIRPNN